MRIIPMKLRSVLTRYGDLIMYDVFLLINIESLNKKDTWKVAAK